MGNYEGNVKLKCPHCGYEEDWGLIQFSPMAIMASNASMWRDKENGELMDSGKAICENCSEKFLFKFSVVPTVLTAKLPDYN